MEGPTPVSALIHAATMVTAGVYLIVRSEPIFARSPAASTTVAVIGVVTSIYAGLSAIGQDDIKRVLAYSTISQIGLMLLAAGVGAPSAAIFLLVTHAFYKALLFLSAGSVIHGLHDEQDMMKMGGLRRVMPFTTVAWVIGALAIAGGPAARRVLLQGRGDGRGQPGGTARAVGRGAGGLLPDGGLHAARHDHDVLRVAAVRGRAARAVPGHAVPMVVLAVGVGAGRAAGPVGDDRTAAPVPGAGRPRRGRPGPPRRCWT